MMKLKSFRAPIIAATLATTALKQNGLAAYFLPPLSDGLDQVLATISVRAPLTHRFTHPYSRPLYQLSYRGTQSVASSCFGGTSFFRDKNRAAF